MWHWKDGKKWMKKTLFRIQTYKQRDARVAVVAAAVVVVVVDDVNVFGYQ